MIIQIIILLFLQLPLNNEIVNIFSIQSLKIFASQPVFLINKHVPGMRHRLYLDIEIWDAYNLFMISVLEFKVLTYVAFPTR